MRIIASRTIWHGWMSTKAKGVCAFWLLFIAAIGNVWGGDCYVAPNGNDSNPGTESQPWLTIQQAANTLTAGDTAYIRAGTYAERVFPQNSGDAGQYITYAAYPGETATIDGASIVMPEWTGLFDITNRAYIRVSGLRILNSGPNLHNSGILADTSSHIIIEDNYIYNSTDSGIGVWTCSDVTVDGNEVETACTRGYNECISVGVTDGFEVKNNHVHHSAKEGICTKDGSSNGKVFGNKVHDTVRVGYYVDAQDKHTYNIEVFGNVAHDINENGFAIASEVGGLLENVKVYNNVAYNNGWTGLQVTACCIATHPMANIQIVNNTFYNNGKPPWGGGIYLENPQAQGVVIRNNICSQNLTFQLAVSQDVPAGNFTADHNLIDGYRGSDGEIHGEAWVEGYPQFASSATANFRLLSGSPAIDAGKSTDAPLTDFAGVMRPQDGDGNGLAVVDIGAYEYHRPAAVSPKTWALY